MGWLHSGKILTDSMYIRQHILTILIENIERENFDGVLAKHQIRQCFALSINCAICMVLQVIAGLRWAVMKDEGLHCVNRSTV